MVISVGNEKKLFGIRIRIEHSRLLIHLSFSFSLTRMTENYKLRCALRHDDEVRGIAICGNTGKIVTSSDKLIRLWTVQGEHLWKHTYPSPVQCISWIPSNPTLQSGGVSVCMKNVVLVWDLDSRKMVKSLVGHESQVTGIVVDGDDLVSSSIDGYGFQILF